MIAGRPAAHCRWCIHSGRKWPLTHMRFCHHRHQSASLYVKTEYFRTFQENVCPHSCSNHLSVFSAVVCFSLEISVCYCTHIVHLWKWDAVPPMFTPDKLLRLAAAGNIKHLLWIFPVKSQQTRGIQNSWCKSFHEMEIHCVIVILFTSNRKCNDILLI